jgi:hypothetical protein
MKWKGNTCMSGTKEQHVYNNNKQNKTKQKGTLSPQLQSKLYVPKMVQDDHVLVRCSSVVSIHCNLGWHRLCNRRCNADGIVVSHNSILRTTMGERTKQVDGVKWTG